ncbi:CMF_collapsed_G0013090.mRNA.1.CDS.1 [Saccharomyces cerevisiae]|nr:CMF_collapsed_G0013090.mRNA.1.CDS.1 [Saccharomyces cerevisiae]
MLYGIYLNHYWLPVSSDATELFGLLIFTRLRACLACAVEATIPSYGFGNRFIGDVEDDVQFNWSYFLSLLKDADIIESSSYSLWLAGDTSTYKTYRDPISNCGKLFLGGVDPSLFTGTLGKFDLIPYVDPVSNAVSVGYPIVPLGPIYIVSNSGKSLNMTSKDFLSPALHKPLFQL